MVWLILLGLTVVVVWWSWRRRSQRLQLRQQIDLYRLPAVARRKWLERYPQLGPDDYQLAEEALRQFFMAYFLCRQPLAMPSRAADELWHEFILCTREYADFCQQAFGAFFHHSAATEPNQLEHYASLVRCWQQVCRLENLEPEFPLRLPLLFALDRRLGIEDGFYYTLDAGTSPWVMIEGRRYYRVPHGRRNDDGGGSCSGSSCSGGDCKGGNGDSGGGCGGGGD